MKNFLVKQNKRGFTRQNFFRKISGGYTIIETMIAVSLFIIITTIGIGALLNANLLHEKSSDMRSIMDNLSFIMEDMSRNLRTGYNYYCATGGDNLSNVATTKSTPVIGGVPQNCWGIAFESSGGDPNDDDDQWVYYIDSTGKIFKSTQGPYDIFPSNYFQLTPNEVEIDTTASGFSVLGAEPPPGDTQQPFVTIKLVGEITYKDVVTPFSLQTSVSQRLVDI